MHVGRSKLKYNAGFSVHAFQCHVPAAFHPCSTTDKVSTSLQTTLHCLCRLMIMDKDTGVALQGDLLLKGQEALQKAKGAIDKLVKEGKNVVSKLQGGVKDDLWDQMHFVCFSHFVFQTVSNASLCSCSCSRLESFCFRPILLCTNNKFLRMYVPVPAY